MLGLSFILNKMLLITQHLIYMYIYALDIDFNYGYCSIEKNSKKECITMKTNQLSL